MVKEMYQPVASTELSPDRPPHEEEEEDEDEEEEMDEDKAGAKAFVHNYQQIRGKERRKQPQIPSLIPPPPPPSSSRQKRKLGGSSNSNSHLKLQQEDSSPSPSPSKHHHHPSSSSNSSITSSSCSNIATSGSGSKKEIMDDKSDERNGIVGKMDHSACSSTSTSTTAIASPPSFVRSSATVVEARGEGEELSKKGENVEGEEKGGEGGGAGGGEVARSSSTSNSIIMDHEGSVSGSSPRHHHPSAALPPSSSSSSSSSSSMLSTINLSNSLQHHHQALGDNNESSPCSSPSSPSNRSKHSKSYLPLISIPQASMNIVANIAYLRTTQEIVQLRLWSTEGPIWTRALGFLGGLCLLCRESISLLSTLSHPTSSLPHFLHQLLTGLFGLSAILLECRTVFCNVPLRKRTREYLKLLSFLWGRGLYYLLAGCMVIAAEGGEGKGGGGGGLSKADLVFAIHFVLLGAIDIGVGWTAKRRLSRMRGTLTEDEKVLKDRFNRADREKDGRVPVADLAFICVELGSQLSHTELEGAILMLDEERSGYVEYDAFLEWWRTR